MKLKLPSKIGFAVDPMLPPAHPMHLDTLVFDGNIYFLLHICDLLLLYDQILIRADWWTLNQIYSSLSCEDLQPLFENGRIKYFAPMNQASSARPILNTNSGKINKKFILELENSFKPVSDTMFISSLNQILDQIENNTTENQAIDSDKCHRLQESLMEIFFNNGADKLPTDRSQLLYHEVGFRNGIGRILDIWSTGNLAIHLDYEMKHYLDMCSEVPSEINNCLPTVQQDTVDKLNSIRNIPSVKVLLMEGDIEKSKFIKIALSDESSKLRKWIRDNLDANMDVRDCYFKAFKDLPSKSGWANWLRFGVSTTLSTSLSFVLTGSPLLATLLGISAGAADVAYGEKMVSKVTGQYHPEEWLSYFETTTK